MEVTSQHHLFYVDITIQRCFVKDTGIETSQLCSVIDALYVTSQRCFVTGIVVGTPQHCSMVVTTMSTCHEPTVSVRAAVARETERCFVLGTAA